MFCTEIVSDIQNIFCAQNVLPMFCKKKSFWQRFTCKKANQFEPSSSAVSCEKMLLAESSNQKAKETTAKKQRVKSVTASNKVPFSPQGSLDALLKLAQYPIKVQYS